MPYRQLPLVVGILIALALLAFWPGYVSQIGIASWLAHLHGITATLWMLAVAFQAWSINGKRRDLHRAGGLATLAMFPLYMAGAGAVTYSMAAATAAGNAFYQLWGSKLGIVDALSAVAILWLVHIALAGRRNLALHANAMVATLIFSVMPIMSRLCNHMVPGLRIDGPADFPSFSASFQLSQLLGLLAALWLARRAGRNRRPFLIVAGFIIVQSLLFETFAATSLWQGLHRSIATIAPGPVLAFHALLGALVVWHGWQAGARTGRAAPRLPAR